MGKTAPLLKRTFPIRYTSEPGGPMAKKAQPRTEYAGKLIGVTRGIDGIKIITHCHYSTPFGTFTDELDGWQKREPTSPALKGYGGGR